MGWLSANSTLRERIKDLEKSLESHLGQTQILSEQLKKAEERERILQEKLFEVSGITPREKLGTASPIQRNPIRTHQKTSNWKDIQTNLELAAREEYWSKKKQEESQSSVDRSKDIDLLEAEVLNEKY